MLVNNTGARLYAIQLYHAIQLLRLLLLLLRLLLLTPTTPTTTTTTTTTITTTPPVGGGGVVVAVAPTEAASMWVQKREKQDKRATCSNRECTSEKKIIGEAAPLTANVPSRPNRKKMKKGMRWSKAKFNSIVEVALQMSSNGGRPNLEFAEHLSPFWDLDLSASYRKLSAPSVVLHPAIIVNCGSHGRRPTDLSKQGNISGNIE